MFARNCCPRTSASPLSLELQWMIIEHLHGLKEPQGEERLLHAPTDERRRVTNTLRSCSLVCKNWFLICRRFLMRDVHLSSMTHLEDIASSVYSAIGSPYPHIVNMVLGSSPSATDPRPFHHLAPHHLATKSASLIALYISGDKFWELSRNFPIPKSLHMHMRHFRSLTKLRLIHLHFQSLWDLRRLIVFPPSLSSLWLRDVSWPSPFRESPRVPSLLITPPRLSEVTISEVSCPWEVLWFWTTSCTPTVSGVVEESSTPEHPFPAFTPRDTTIIVRLIQKLLPSVDAPEFHWSYREERRDWEISYSDSECAENAMRIRVQALKCSKRPRAQLPRSPTRPESRVCRVHSLACTTFFPPPDWKDVDGLCNSLDDLEEIRFSVSNSLSDHEDVIREISRSLTSLWDRVNLSLFLMVDGVVVEDNDLAEAGNEGEMSSWVISPAERRRVYDLFSSDYDRQLDATTRFRGLLSPMPVNPLSQIKRVINFGIVPRFVQFLQSNLPTLQCEAAGALAEITSQPPNSGYVEVVINAKAVPEFIKMVSDLDPDVRAQATRALGNIARDSPTCRDHVLQAGALGPLMALFRENHGPEMLRIASRTLRHFCGGEDPSPNWELISPALTVLPILLHSSDHEVLIDACNAVSFLSNGSNDKVQAVIESGICARLIQFLRHSSTSIQAPALRSAGNIASGNYFQTQFVVRSGALPALLSLLSSPDNDITSAACWTIYKITDRSPARIQAIIDANIIPSLINVLQNADFGVRMEACRAISSATYGGPSQIRYLVSQGCIKPLCDLLSMTNPEVVQAALDGLDNILEVGEMDKRAAGRRASNLYALRIEETRGAAAIQDLKQHVNIDISDKAFDMIANYFPDDEDVDAGTSTEDEGGDDE